MKIYQVKCDRIEGLYDGVDCLYMLRQDALAKADQIQKHFAQMESIYGGHLCKFKTDISQTDYSFYAQITIIGRSGNELGRIVVKSRIVLE